MDGAEASSWKWGGSETLGAGVAVGYINDNYLPNLVAVWIDDTPGDNYAYYRIGWDMDQNGIILDENWTERRLLGTSPVSDAWYEARGAGAALADFDQNGRPKLIVSYIDPYYDPEIGWLWNDLYYRIGWNLNTNGNANTWTDHYVTTIGMTSTEGAGVAVSDINGNSTPDITIMYTRTSTHIQYYIIG